MSVTLAGANLVVERLSVSYGSVPAVRDVTLTVAPGECVALFGRNGAGKTTLLEAVAGGRPTVSGSVRCGGRDLTRLKPWARVRHGLALVPEGRRLFGHLTVGEHLRLGALAAPMPTVTEADVYATFPILRERRHQRVSTMSGGQQQMVALARALMTSASVLLVDEMSAGLSPLATHDLVLALHRAREVGTAILLVEQNPAVVEMLVDRAYVMDRGRCIVSGTLADLGGSDALARSYLGLASAERVAPPESVPVPMTTRNGRRRVDR
jgi:branched-chain amino acid transport system ATP-binding protein